MSIIKTEDVASTFSQSLVLVGLTLRAYGTEKIDKTQTKKLRTENNVKKNAVTVKKVTLPTSPKLDDIKKLHRLIRTGVFERFGAPYMKGVRMVPATKYLDLLAELKPLLRQRDELVDQFMADYGNYIEGAKVDLGTSFDPADYPSPESVRASFGHEMSVQPVADPRTLSLSGVLDEASEAIQIAVNETFREKTETLAPYIREILLKPLTHMSSTLQKLLKNPDTRIFASMFANLQEAAEQAKHLNVLDDPMVTNAVHAIVQNLSITPDAVNDDPQRTQMAINDANTIIESLEGSVPDAAPDTVPTPAPTPAPTPVLCDVLPPPPAENIVPELAEAMAEPEPVPVELVPEILEPIVPLINTTLEPERDVAPEPVDVADANPANDLLAKLGWV